MSSLPAVSLDSIRSEDALHVRSGASVPIAVLIVVPTLDGGAADAGAVELVRILSGAGHRATVVSLSLIHI